MFDFFRNYPLAFYMRTFAGLPTPVDIAFLLKGNENVAMLSRRNSRFDSLFQAHVQNKTGAPVLLSQSAGAAKFNSGVFPAANSRNRFILDCQDTVVMLFQTSSLDAKTAEDLRSTPISTLLPTFDANISMKWEFLAPNLSRLTDPLPTSFFLVGIPTHYCRWIEQWTEAAGGAVVTIVPLLLATLNLCRDKSQMVLLPGSKSSQLCVIQNDCYVFMSRQAAFPALKPDHLHATVEELSNNFHLQDARLDIMPFSDISITRLREFTAAFPSSSAPAPRIMQATPKHSIHVDDNSAMPIEACIMEGLFQ